MWDELTKIWDETRCLMFLELKYLYFLLEMCEGLKLLKPILIEKLQAITL